MARGDAATGARLFGATEAFLSEIGASFEPPDLAELERNTAAARDVLAE